jgi:endonuclease-8
VPEGDTLRRTADVLGRALVGDEIVSAAARPGGPQLGRVVGSRIDSVRSRGKHLLIDFDAGLTLHTHLGMSGSWHRYRPGEPWRRPREAMVAVLETRRSVAVCFEAPTVELLDTRALPLHPAIATLGPDLLDEPLDIGAALARLRAPERAALSVAEVLLDQRAVTGIGNVYRSEVLFVARVDPLARVESLADRALERLLRTAAALLRANLTGGARVTLPSHGRTGPGVAGDSRAGRHWVYGRAGRPCRRCGAIIRSSWVGRLPRRLYWCPRCQPAGSVSPLT